MLRSLYPNEDPYYLLDLLLCAHVRRDYYFELSRRDNQKWEEFEKRVINWSRKRKLDIHRDAKKTL